MAKARDLTGLKLGRLTVVSFSGTRRNSAGTSIRTWKCDCECGKTDLIFDAGRIMSGNTRSCGCLYTDTHTKHGLHNSRIYFSWGDMKRRCNNPKSKAYPDYGGRGITYDPRWESFENFYEDMLIGYSDTLTLERIDPNGNYCKDNCKWASKSEQSRNRTMMVTNTSGVTGVRKSYNKKNDTHYYVAEARFHEITKSKWFSIKIYGEDVAFKLACEQRKAFIKELNELGANFTPEHGLIGKGREVI